MSEKQLVQNFKEDIANQDNLLDECFGLLKQNRNTNKQIDNELGVQEKHIDELGGQIQKVKGRVDKTNTKLNTYNEKSSNNWLIMVICIELIILILVTLVL